MPICPNKATDAWKDLVEKIKGKFNVPDDIADKLAEVSFHVTGDIPSFEKAESILSSGSISFTSKTIKQSINGMFKQLRAKTQADLGYRFGFAEGQTVGQIEQQKAAQKEINNLNKKLAKNEITRAQLEDRVKELGYNVKWLTAEASLAGRIEGKRQGRIEGRAEQKQFQKEFYSQLSEHLNELVGKGKISNVQSQAIARRAFNVGTSESSFKTFTDYVDKVVKNADYDNQMASIKKLQDAAKRIKSALSSEVKIFTNVNPENIPTSMIPKYMEALNLLTGDVPNPKLLKELTFEIQKIKSDASMGKAFENVTTMAQAEEVFKKIYEPKLESIEDYNNVIRDTNNLKKKLNELIDNGDIKQEDYDAISERIALDQKTFEERNKAQIDVIKQGFVEEIISNKIEPNYSVNKEEQILIDNINNLKEEDLLTLSANQLHNLHEAIGVANDGYIDVARLDDIVTSIEANSAKSISDQLNSFKQIVKDKYKLVEKMMKRDDTQWEKVLGLPSYKIGPLFLELISPFRKGVGDFVKYKKEIKAEIYKIQKKYKLNIEDSNRIGFIVHYLQEYQSKFDPEYKNIKDIGTRDEFSEKLYDKRFQTVDNSETKKMMLKIYESLPKDSNGKVNPEDVYNDFINNGEKYLSKNQKAVRDEVWKLFEDKVTDKLQYATNLRDKSLKLIPTYMKREYYSKSKIPEASIELFNNGKGLRVKSESSNERISKDIMSKDNNLPKTDFIYLMDRAGTDAMKDFHLTKTLKDINARLDVVYKTIDDKNQFIVDATVDRIREGLIAQVQGFTVDGGSQIMDKVRSAKSVMVLLDPLKTFIGELPSGLLSYPLRSGAGLKAYYHLFKSGKISDDLKNFTRSPITIKENINANFNVDAQKMVRNERLSRATTWLSGFTESHLNNMIWYPVFIDAFKEIANQNFESKKFYSDPSYKIKFKKEINDAGSVADNRIQEIIGVTTTASGKLNIEGLWTKPFRTKPISINSEWGKSISYMGGFNFRDNLQFFGGFRDMAEMFRDGYGAKSLTALSKPLGVLVGITSAAYLSGVRYVVESYVKSLITGDKEQVDYAIEQLKSKTDFSGAMKELGANVTQMSMGRYGAEGRMAVQALMTAAYYSTDDIETRESIYNFAQNVTFQKIPVLETKRGNRVSTFKEQSELGLQITQNMVVASTALTTLVDLVGGVQAADELLKDYEDGNISDDKKEIALALKTVVTAAELFLLTKGVSLPNQRLLQKTLDGIINEGEGRRTYK